MKRCSPNSILFAALLMASPAAAQSWEKLTSPNPDTMHNNIFGIGGSGSGNVWAVGTYQKVDVGAGQTYGENLLLRWNGIGWTQYSLPVAGNSGDDILDDVLVLSSTNAWAAGFYRDGTDFTPQLLGWDGNSWTNVNVPAVCNRGTLNTFKAFSTSDIWAAGNLSDGVSDSNYVLRYNGSSWSAIPVLPAGITSGSILDMDGTSSTDLWAVGSKVTSGFDNNALVMHFDGSSWTHIPIPTNPFPGLGTVRYVKALGPNNIVVSVDVFPGSVQLLHYNGSAWRLVSVPPSPSQSLHSIVLDTNNIFHWANAGIFHYNGAVWTKMDTVAQACFPDVWASALLPDGHVWVAGGCYESAARTSTLVYRTKVPLSINESASKALTASVFPNPSKGAVTLRLEAAPGQQLAVSVCDQLGRVVLERELRVQQPVLEFELDLQQQAPGMYHLRMVDTRSGQSSVVKLLRE